MTRLAAVIAGLAVATCLPVAAHATGAPPATRPAATGVGTVELVIDVSGSMADEDGNGTVKLAGAKQAMVALLDGLPTDVRVALRTYPANGADCGPGTLEADMFTARDVVGQRIRALQADGGTPTDEALAAAADDLRAAGVAKSAVIVLVSDGESNCSRNPCEVAAEIAESGVEITVNTIGFKISDAGAAELECIANATGGVYRDAENAAELAESLGALAGSSVRVDVTAPTTVLRAVGRGENPDVQIRTNVINTSPNAALNIRTQIAVTSERRPFILNPVRQIGNLEVGDSREVVWTFTPPLDFADASVSFDVTVSGPNIATQTEPLTIQLKGAVSAADAAALLTDAARPVILGDSYSAGEGAGTYDSATTSPPNTCHRSDDTYGKALWPDSRTILACSGAVIANLHSAQNPTAPAQLTQLAALTDAPDLALMTLGGNDAQFKDIIMNCLQGGECHEKRTVTEVECELPDFFARIRAESSLEDELNATVYPGPTRHCFIDHGAYGDVMLAQAKGLLPRLEQAYLDIDAVLNSPAWLGERGRPAALVVLAYPSPVPDPGRYAEVVRLCGEGLSYEEWRWVVTFQATLNATIETAVRQARDQGAPVYYAADVADAFEPAHTLCDGDAAGEQYLNDIDLSTVGGAVGEQAVNGLTWILLGTSAGLSSRTQAVSEFFHPNADGYQAMTAALIEFSNTPAGLEPVTRTRSAPPEVRPLPSGPTIAVSGSTSALAVARGEVTSLTLADLQPASEARVLVQSDPQLLAATTAQADGTARLEVAFPHDFEAGEHTLTIVSTSADGVVSARSMPLAVGDRTPLLERLAPWLALAALTVAVVLGGLYLLARREPRGAANR